MKCSITHLRENLTLFLIVLFNSLILFFIAASYWIRNCRNYSLLFRCDFFILWFLVWGYIWILLLKNIIIVLNLRLALHWMFEFKNIVTLDNHILRCVWIIFCGNNICFLIIKILSRKNLFHLKFSILCFTWILILCYFLIRRKTLFLI